METNGNTGVSGEANKADRHKSRTRNSISHFAKKKVKCDGPTDRPTDGPTDRRTDGPTDTVAYRVVCTRLKTVFQQSNPTGWTLSAQQFRRYSILKLGSRPKYRIFFIFLQKKIKKLAQFHHFYSQHLSLIQFLTCPVSYQAST